MERESWPCPSCQETNTWWHVECSNCRTEDPHRQQRPKLVSAVSHIVILSPGCDGEIHTTVSRDEEALFLNAASVMLVGRQTLRRSFSKSKSGFTTSSTRTLQSWASSLGRTVPRPTHGWRRW